MTSRLEYVSPEGLRLDGRRPQELRGLTAKLGILPQMDGSALFELGNTRVLATVTGPHEVQDYNIAVILICLWWCSRD